MDFDGDADGDGRPDFPYYTCNSPDRTPNVICVTDSFNRDQLNPRAAFGATSVDLGAPGFNIVSLRHGRFGGGTSVATGTSFAAPHVSGVAALAFAVFPTKTTAEVKQDLLLGSDGPIPASGVDIVFAGDAGSLLGKTSSGGRLRWPYTGDFGDAPDSYNTLAGSKGPLHWDIGNEFFGDDVTAEPDALIVNEDRADQPLGPGTGQFVLSPPPPWRPRQVVTVDYVVCSDYFGVSDARGGQYFASTPDEALYVNAWFDLNRSGTFEAGELLLTDILSPLISLTGKISWWRRRPPMQWVAIASRPCHQAGMTSL